MVARAPTRRRNLGDVRMPRATRFRYAIFTGLLVACSLDERQLQLGGTSGSDGSGAYGGEDSGDPSPAGGEGSDPDSSAGAGSDPDVPAVCGDGVVSGDEGCDDGGESDGDGCDTACAVEDGYECSGSPSSCFSCVGDVGAKRCQVAGGPYERGPVADRLPASVAPFLLDELEVTVARFRPFVTDFAGPPSAGSGAHPNVAGSGWREEWASLLPVSASELDAALHCNHDWETWSSDPAEKEDFPITCASYYLAFAFCVAQGGRLPSEAEWEYVAAGGAQQRIYPWGDSEPNAELAQYQSLSAAAVGTHAQGKARFGPQDLAGSVWEWTLDYFGTYPGDCDRCAEVENGFERVLRGGDWLGDASYLAASFRFQADPAAALANVGFRCAYDP